MVPCESYLKSVIFNKTQDVTQDAYNNHLLPLSKIPLDQLINIVTYVHKILTHKFMKSQNYR